MSDPKIIYDGFMLNRPLAISLDGPYEGWLSAKHPDGQWVTLVNLSEVMKDQECEGCKCQKKINSALLQKINTKDATIARLEKEVERLKAYIVDMVNIAAESKLDGYRELGTKAANAENDRDTLRASLAAAEAREKGLKKEVDMLIHFVPEGWPMPLGYSELVKQILTEE